MSSWKSPRKRVGYNLGSLLPPSRKQTIQTQCVCWPANTLGVSFVAVPALRGTTPFGTHVPSGWTVLLRGFVSWLSLQMLLALPSDSFLLWPNPRDSLDILTKTYFHFLFSPDSGSQHTYPVNWLDNISRVALWNLSIQFSLFRVTLSPALSWWLGEPYLSVWTLSFPDQPFLPDTWKFTHLSLILLDFVWLNHINTLSLRLQICNRILSAAITATEPRREEWESWEGPWQGWESLIQGLNWAFFVREFGVVVVTVVMGKPAWGLQSWLTGDFSSEIGFSFSALTICFQPLTEKINLTFASGECVIDLKRNTSIPWFSLFCVGCPNVVPFLYASPSQSSHGRWFSMRHLNHSLGEHQDSFTVSPALMKPLAKLA